jgi:hypothetical protein
MECPYNTTFSPQIANAEQISALKSRLKSQSELSKNTAFKRLLLPFVQVKPALFIVVAAALISGKSAETCEILPGS